MNLSPLSRALTIAAIFTAAYGPQALASALVFEPNNAAIFSGANPNGNGLMLATAVKPKNTGDSAATGPLGLQDQATAIQQAILSQLSSKINNEIFNCGNTCQSSGNFKVNNSTVLAYEVNPLTGALSLVYDTPGVGKTTVELGKVNRGETTTPTTR